MSAQRAFSCRHGTRLTVILAANLVEAYDRARPFIGMADADMLELRLIGPVWDPAAPGFTQGGAVTPAPSLP